MYFKCFWFSRFPSRPSILLSEALRSSVGSYSEWGGGVCVTTCRRYCDSMWPSRYRLLISSITIC